MINKMINKMIKEEDDLPRLQAQVQPDVAEIRGLPPQPPQQDDPMVERGTTGSSRRL